MSTNFNNSGSHGSHTRKSAISSVSFDSSVSHKSKRHKRFSGNARSHSYSNSSRHRYESDKDSYTKLLQEFYAYNDSKYLADSDSQYTILRHWQDSSENVHFRELDRIVKHNTLFAEDNPDYFSLLEVESEPIDIEDLRDWIVLSSKAKATCLHILQDTAYKENILPHYDLFNCTEEVYEGLQEKQRELLRNFPNILNEAYLRAKKYLLPELALYYNIEFFKTRRLQISVSVIYKYLEDNMEEILPKAFKSEKDRLKFLTTEDVIGYQILLSDERKLSNSDKSKKAKIMIQNMTKDIYSVYGAFCNKNRHFILHIGPTNSGKTYDAIQALKSAESGILWNATKIRESLELPKIRFAGFHDIKVVPGDELIETLASSYSHVGNDETLVVTRSNKRANIYNQGIRNMVLGREDELCSNDRIMIVKNNYFWGHDSKEIDFIANGDMAVVRRVRNIQELYGLRFADVTMTFPDYNDFELTATVLLDTLTSEAPALTREQQEQLYNGVMEDYAEIRFKSERLKKLKEDRFYNALQIKFAYAATCHKAQGGQWAHVYVDQGYMTDDMLNSDYMHWLYTAFTRATEQLYLVNWPKTQIQNE